MKRKFFLLIIMSIVTLGTLSFFSNPNVTEPPKIENGLIDLSQWSFKTDGIVSLSGGWSFYFNEFLTHEDFKRGVNRLPIAITVPSTKSEMKEIKPFKSNKFYGTLRLVIKLPKESDQNSPIYGLRSNIVLSAYKLFVDGKSSGEVGQVGNSSEKSKPYYKSLNTFFYSESNEIELIYHTSDFYTEDCAITAPSLGLSDQILDESRFAMGRDFFLFGMLLIMGVYHLGLYLKRRKELAPLYFGIFCLTFALRMIIVGERILPSVMVLPLGIYFRIVYICAFVGFASFGCFMYHTVTGLFPKWYLRVNLFAGALSLLISVICPIVWIDAWLEIYAVFAILQMIYAVWRLVYGAWKGYKFSRGVLIGTVCLFTAILNDFIYQMTLANKASMIPLGVAIFIITQAYTLSTKFSFALTRSEELFVENESIMFELKHVNTNLESIVENRTAALKKALDNMEIMSKIDYLTKLPNRRLMFQKIEDFLEEKRNFYIAVADIDNFKIVNDTYGHEKGDQILIRVADVLNETLKGIGYVARWGGEEFLIIIFTDQDDVALMRANLAREAVAAIVAFEVPLAITITIGLCKHLMQNTIDISIANADAALYQGKENGRNQCKLLSE